MKDGLNPVETRILVKGLTKQEQQFDKVTAVGFAGKAVGRCPAVAIADGLADSHIA